MGSTSWRERSRLLHSSGGDWDTADDLVEAGVVPSQLWVGFVSLWGRLHCVVTAFLSTQLCHNKSSCSRWSTPHFLGWSHQHCTPDLEFSRIQALSNPPAFWRKWLQLRVFLVWALISRNSSSWRFELKFIHLDGMLRETSTLYMTKESPLMGLQMKTQTSSCMVSWIHK